MTAGAARWARRWLAASAAAWCLGCHTPCLAATLSELLACRDLVDPAARLACFDRAAAALAPTQGSPAAARAVAGATASPSASAGAAASPAPSTVNPTSPRPAAILSPEQQFGLPAGAVTKNEVAAGVRAADAARVEAHIARMTTAADGRVVFTLDNAQVWKQLQSAADLLAKPGDSVTISRGWLSSYWLQVQSGRGCKVTRLR